ncbi:hypothetical protein RJ45_05720 [Photobacterium gaetbulicola]|uniref:Uncharacterized protein n=1 Tax=Photobacterium gaetbulicola TaxID=1295392 RepID=A0A0B9GIE9_9GAMM|nr:hypothetical protein [Photobacterium gaetbulicola]KHT64570.1 hypothetical protein RJ45_05720 [Photobacterium gaetbulicola]
MTGKTLRERLPVGNPRNKVEFLADEFEKTANDLYALLGAGNAAVNLLANPQFNEVYKSSSHVLYINNLNMTAGQKPNLDLTMANGRGSMLVSDSWAVELPYTKDQTAKFYNTGRNFTWADSFDRESGVLQYSAEAFTLYQVATVPFNGLDHNKLKARFSLTGWAGTKVRVGIAMIQAGDGQMKVDYVDAAVREYEFKENIPFDNPVTVESEELDLYLHGVSPNCMVAPFLEITDAIGYGYVYNAALWHAGVYGDDPKAFINQTNPYGYAQFINESSFKSIEDLGGNLVKLTTKRNFPYFQDPRQHFLTYIRDYSSAKVVDVQPDSVTINLNNEDYATFQSKSNPISDMWYQYSMMPIGLGFYK